MAILPISASLGAYPLRAGATGLIALGLGIVPIGYVSNDPSLVMGGWDLIWSGTGLGVFSNSLERWAGELDAERARRYRS